MKKIIGNGDIAKALKKTDKNYLFFASGVSNSQETRESEYEREKKLLLQQKKDKKIIYFSSLCIFYANSRYAKHKIEMEKLIKNNFSKYCIIRLGNITWGKNPFTLINALKRQHKENKSLRIENVYRYIIEQKEFLHWINMIPDNYNCEMNIPGKMMKVKEIVKKYVLKHK